MEPHIIHAELLRRRVRVLVVGCGGTGSAVVGGLPYLHHAMIAHGHPEGLHVTVMDGDVISPTNSVRQPFSRYEVGLYKVVVLVNRLNLFWNFGWEAVPEHLTRKEPLDRVDIVIGCVDTRAARAVIRECTSRWSATPTGWTLVPLADAGQFILGEPLNQVNRRSRTRLRTVAELYPESVDGSLDDDGLPSCSAVEALSKTRAVRQSGPRPARSCFAGTALPIWEHQLSRRVHQLKGRHWREAGGGPKPMAANQKTQSRSYIMAGVTPNSDPALARPRRVASMSCKFASIARASIARSLRSSAKSASEGYRNSISSRSSMSLMNS